MGYNLWQSDDSRYTLGFRMGARAGNVAEQPEQRADAPVETSKAEMAHIDFLMEKLARRLDSAKPEASSGTDSIAC